MWHPEHLVNMVPRIITVLVWAVTLTYYYPKHFVPLVKQLKTHPRLVFCCICRWGKVQINCIFMLSFCTFVVPCFYVYKVIQCTEVFLACSNRHYMNCTLFCISVYQCSAHSADCAASGVVSWEPIIRTTSHTDDMFPLVLSDTTAMCEANQMNSCRDNRGTDR